MPLRKNSFKSPEHIQVKIVDEDENVLGTIRVNPAAVKWKPKSAQKFLSVPLGRFIEWITDPDTKAKRTKS